MLAASDEEAKEPVLNTSTQGGEDRKMRRWCTAHVRCKYKECVIGSNGFPVSLDEAVKKKYWRQ